VFTHDDRIDNARSYSTVYSLQAAKSTGINALMLNEVTEDKFFLILDKILTM
jgi:tRNA A-37 threonylcarbamoyl transferase component Bud32